MKYVNVVVGNSSSGIIEAPSFKVPTVNIGDRQKGRIQAESIINCGPNKNEIYGALKKALSHEFKETLKYMRNPYGDGDVSGKVIMVIKESLNNGIDIKKVFYDNKR